VTKKKVRKIKSAKPGAGVKTSEAAAKDAASSSSATAASAKKLDAKTSQPEGKIAAIKQFLADVRGELDKITWASRKETTSLTIAVLAITIFFSAYLGLVDIALSKLVGSLIK